MLSNLKRLPDSPQVPHATGEPRTWCAFPPEVALPPSPSSADPETAPGGGGGDVSGAGDPAAEDEGSPLDTPGSDAGSTSGEGDAPSGGAGAGAAADSCCAARSALSRATFALRVPPLRAMPEEKLGREGRAQAEPLRRTRQRIVTTNGHTALRTPCRALRAS